MYKADEEIKQAQKVLEEISRDEKEQYLAEQREKYILEINTMKAEGLEKGMAEGLEKGIAKGQKSKAIEIAKKMKDKKTPINEIIEITELTKEEIDNL